MDHDLVLKNKLKEIRSEQGLFQAELALILCIALDKKFEDIFYFD